MHYYQVNHEHNPHAVLLVAARIKARRYFNITTELTELTLVKPRNSEKLHTQELQFKQQTWKLWSFGSVFLTFSTGLHPAFHRAVTERSRGANAAPSSQREHLAVNPGNSFESHPGNSFVY